MPKEATFHEDGRKCWCLGCKSLEKDNSHVLKTWKLIRFERITEEITLNGRKSKYQQQEIFN